MKLKILILVMMGFFIAKAQSYYVDGINGVNSNNGTTLTTAWKTIQKSMTNATPGSTVYIKAGTYQEALSLNVSGTVGNYITFRNYQNDAVYIDGNNQNVTLLYISNKNYFNIRGLIFQNTLGSNSNGIEISGTSHHFSFIKNTIQGVKWTTNPATPPTSGNNVSTFVVYGNSTSSSINNVLVDSNEIKNNINGYSENLTMNGNVELFTISHNLIHDNTNIGIDCAGNFGACNNPLLDQARNGIISDNICYNNNSPVATGAGIYIDGAKDIVIERNTCYGNGYGIEVGAEENGTVSGIIVRDNLIYNNEEGGFSLGGYTTATTGQVINSSFINNTLFSNNSTGSGAYEIILSKASNCIIKNNIICSGSLKKLLNRDNISPQSGNIFAYNTWYTPNNNSNSISIRWGSSALTSFTLFATNASDNTSNYANPNFVNTTLSTLNLHLLSTSVCRDAGDPSFTPASGERDLEGNLRVLNSVVDKGAYEYVAVSSAVPSNTITPTVNSCVFSVISFSSSSTNSPTAYTWTISSSISSQTSTLTNPSYTTNTSGTHTLSLITRNSIGSSSISVITFSVYSLPTITLTATTSSICSGNSSPLNASGASSYTWSNGANTTSISVSPTVTTTYTITGKSIQGCINTKSISINVIAKPIVNIVSTSSVLCVGQTAVLTASGANSYLWNTGGTSASISITPNITTTYSVTGNSLNGCSANTTISQVVSVCTNLKENTEIDMNIIVFPNPNNGVLCLKNVLPNEKIDVIDELGRNVYSGVYNGKEIVLDNLQSGIYYIKTTNNKTRLIIKR